MRLRSSANAPAGQQRFATLVAALGCLLLTGCTVLAADPTIRPGLEVDRYAPEPALQVAPPGPVQDAKPEDIVRGFIQALTATGGDFVTAREFLTGAARADWSPEVGTVVFRGSVQVAPVDPVPDAPEATESAEAADPEAASPTAEPTASPSPSGTPTLRENELLLRITASSWAEVDREGHFRELPAEVSRSTDVVLRQVDGQWRIRHLDDAFGRWLATSDFERLFDPYAVHYVSQAERVLIPDIRYVPTDRVATRLAQLQLGGPPAYLRGAVRFDIPSGTRLAVGAVPVLGGVATVDLTGEDIGVDPGSRTRLWAMFVATLGQVPSIDRIQITVDGRPLDIQGIERVRSLSDLDFTARANLPRHALIRQGNTLGLFSARPRPADGPAEPTPAPTLEEPLAEVELEWRDLALSAAGTELAGISGDMMSRWRAGIRYEVPGFATELGRPCYDGFNTLWVGGIGRTLARDRLFAVNAAALPADPLRSTASPITASWLNERRVVACHVSPQGTRIAIISDEGAGTPSRLDIGAIVRQPNMLPISVVGPQSIGEHFVDVVDAVWLDETSMAILGQTRANAATLADLPPPQTAPPATPEPSPTDVTEGEESTETEGNEPFPVQGADEDARRAALGIQPYLITVGGRTTTLPTIVGGTRITTTTGNERNLVIVTADGTVYVRVGAQWLRAQDQGSEVIVSAR